MESCLLLYLTSFVQHHVSWDSSMLLCISAVCSFYCWVALPMYKCSTNCPLSHCLFHFLLLWISTMNIHIQVFTWTNIFISLGWIPGNGIARSWGRFMFNFTRNLQRVLQSICTILASHQQCMRVCCSTSSPTFAIVSLFYFIHSNECEMVVFIAF